MERIHERHVDPDDAAGLEDALAFRQDALRIAHMLENIEQHHQVDRPGFHHVKVVRIRDQIDAGPRVDVHADDASPRRRTTGQIGAARLLGPDVEDQRIGRQQASDIGL